ncbi:hypothetical protein NDA07_03375 [Microcoleus vaginatus DQ-U2]|uniref:hypothetical protein n=1 Tax=Microcoleus vaginatus TaxID=119532 RepID=UPI001687E33C|nr:hypothetical protein [Microcoleus sp. FACHB-DQ6]
MIAQTGKRVEEKLISFLEPTQWVNKLNAEAIDRGELNLQLERPQPRGEKFLWQQMRCFKSIQWISFGAEKSGEYLGIWRNPRITACKLSQLTSLPTLTTYTKLQTAEALAPLN